MASAQVQEIQPEPPPPPAKNKGGRPRTRPIAGAAPIPTVIPDTQTDFWEVVGSFSTDEWGKTLSMYLYRFGPKIDRNQTGQRHYVQKFSTPVYPEDIMRSKYGGSGDYYLTLNRYDPITGKTPKLRDHSFRIMNTEFPPRIMPGDWQNDPANSDWLWAKPALLRMQKEFEAQQAIEAGLPVPGAPAAAAAGPVSDTFNLVMSVLDRVLPEGRRDEVAEQVKDLIRERDHGRRGDDPASIVTAIVGAITTLNAGKGDNNELLIEMRKEAAEERRFSRELLMKMNEPKAHKSVVAELKELLALKDSFGALLGRGNGKAAGTDWGEVALRTADKLFGVAPAIVQAFALGKMGVRKPPTAAPATAATPAQVTAGEPAATDAPATQEEIDQMIGAISNQFAEMFDEITPFLVQYFERGLSGMSFREFFKQEYGARTYTYLKQMAPETITAVIERRKTEAPENLRPALVRLKPPEKVLAFVGEFLSDATAPEDEDDDEALPPGEQPLSPERRGF